MQVIIQLYSSKAGSRNVSSHLLVAVIIIFEKLNLD